MKTILKKSKQALEVASSVPTEYRVAAYQEVFRHLLAGKSGAVETTQTDKRIESNEKPAESRAAGFPQPYILAESGTRAQQTVWAVISLREKGMTADNATIRDEIRTEIGTASQSRQDTNKSLRNLTPRYLRRADKAEGRGYEYFPTNRSITLFDDLD